MVSGAAPVCGPDFAEPRQNSPIEEFFSAGHLYCYQLGKECGMYGGIERTHRAAQPENRI